jgi:DNA mismatch repair protein MutS
MSQKDSYNDAPTPMLRQYQRIKSEHPDSILMFRLGDFYEMFFDDAIIASNILDITLTSRNKKDPDPIPLCGVPYHSVEPYIARLLASGKKVAICDQVEDPKLAKGVVKREVTRVFTPGVVSDGLGLDASSHNFLASISNDGEMLGLAIADVSTGFFQASEFATPEELMEELSRTDPRELIVMDDWSQAPTREQISKRFPGLLFTTMPQTSFETAQLSDIGGGQQIASELPAAARAASGALSYIHETQKGRPAQITEIKKGQSGRSMRFDESTRRSLELTETMQGGEREGSLLHALDRTSTAAGARMLRRHVLYPLTDPVDIRARQGAVEAILTDVELLRGLPEALGRIYDIERIVARASAGSANARDLVALRESLAAISGIKGMLANTNGWLGKLARSLDACEELAGEIERTVPDDPPFTVREGGIIREGVSGELDELRDAVANGKRIIASIEAEEREATRIPSLKVKYNKVFGYYLEVTNTHRDKVPKHYIRKQTLTGAERYITPKLKEHEERVLGAGERMRALEYEIFVGLRGKVVGNAARLQRSASSTARIDALVSLARVAGEYDYVRPEVDEGDAIEISEGRHPIVERANPAERFVPNDVRIDGEECRLMMITGPNMAGKSTVMRQTALIVLMAQMGSFVPAASARIGVCDRIFTRVGASDALAQGQSTFMVEMSEAALILREATPRSLIIIDEIGRGTSTFDGLAIAWAVAEEIHDSVRARTMFATHYHELTELALTKPAIKNYHVAVREWNDQVIFLRRLVPGSTSHSYGIQVARLAGLPDSVIDRSTEVLANLEEGEFDDGGRPRIGTTHSGGGDASGVNQFQLFARNENSEIVDKLSEIDATAITPIEALNMLHELITSVTRKS